MQLSYHVLVNDNLFLETLAYCHQGPIWVPAGILMSALCRRSMRHLGHLPKTRYFRFLNAVAVSLAFVQIFLTLNVL